MQDEATVAEACLDGLDRVITRLGLRLLQWEQLNDVRVAALRLLIAEEAIGIGSLLNRIAHFVEDYQVGLVSVPRREDRRVHSDDGALAQRGLVLV